MKSYTGKNLEDVLKQAAEDKGVSVEAVSYTHLDVYKRQIPENAGSGENVEMARDATDNAL